MNFFEKATPESCGISSKNLINFVEALIKGPEDNETHSFMIIRHGKLVCEGHFAPYTGEIPHLLYSVSKSFASMAIGFLVEEGKVSVDDYIYTYFPELITDDINKENLKIKIHDLLSMSFGQQGGAVHEGQNRSDAMLYDFFYRNKDIECGTMFRYDSYGSYMLAALVKKLTGMNIPEYLMPKLFEPLGIELPFYRKDSIGISIGYSGMRLRTCDLAKIGFVYLNGGKWNGKQIIPESWVNLATKKHIPTNSPTGEDWQQGYCYQFWRGRHNTARLCGACGQMCVMMPDYDAIFVVNSGYTNTNISYVLDSFYENVMFNMKDEPLPEDKESNEKLENILSNLRLTFNYSEMSPLANVISGNAFELTDSGRYTSAKFDFTDRKVKVTLVSDNKNEEFTAGFDKPVTQKMVTNLVTIEPEDEFEVMGTACWNTRKDLEITFRFLHTPSILKVVASFTETPEVKLVPVRCNQF